MSGPRRRPSWRPFAPGRGSFRARLSARAGAVLLEVLVALTILSTAGVAMLVLAADASRALERARAAEREMREADAFLHAVALWTREDLDRRLGNRAQGRWRLVIDRTLATLYTVALVDTLSGREVLRSSLYRPEPPRDHP